MWYDNTEIKHRTVYIYMYLCFRDVLTPKKTTKIDEKLFGKDAE